MREQDHLIELRMKLQSLIDELRIPSNGLKHLKSMNISPLAVLDVLGQIVMPSGNIENILDSNEGGNDISMENQVYLENYSIETDATVDNANMDVDEGCETTFEDKLLITEENVIAR